MAVGDPGAAHQTDRDVGAASVGEGLLAAYAVTARTRYRRAAVEAGDYLLGVAEPVGGGLRWPDWADPNGRRSTTHFTSFDDGAAGISDYLWQLFEVTHEQRFRTGALKGMRWLIARAEGPECARGVVLVAVDRRPILARRVQRRRYGPGRHRRGARHLRRSHRGPGLPCLRSRRRRPPARASLPTARGRFRVGPRTTPPRPDSSPAPPARPTCSSSAIGTTAIPVTSTPRAGCWDWVNQQAVGGPVGRAALAAGERRSASSASGFELGAAGIAWVNLQRGQGHGRRAIPRNRAPGGGLAEACRDRRGRVAGDARQTPPHRSTSASTAAPPESAGSSAISPRAGLDPGAEPGGRSVGAGVAACRRAPRRSRCLLVREPDGRPSSAARGAVVALGRGGHRGFAARIAGWAGRGPGGLRTGSQT